MTENQERYEMATRDEVLVPTWAMMKEQAAILHKSGFFPKSVKSPEAAIAIMLAGRELGIGPMESLRSVYIVDGQTTISSGLMGAMIWDAGHAYNIDESTSEACQITFTRSNGQTYTHRFTIEDAAKAGLARKDNWQKYAKAMLFNRCMSAGGRAFMPDVIRKMYTPEELDASVMVSESGDVVIDVEAVDVTQTTTTTQKGPDPDPELKPITNGKPKRGPRPWNPEILRDALEHNVALKADWTNEANPKQIGLLASKLEEALGANQDSQVNRYTFTQWMTSERSLTKVGIAWVATLLDWLLADKDETTGDYPFKDHAVKEANAVLRQAMIDQGQLVIPMDGETVAKDTEDLFGNSMEAFRDVSGGRSTIS